MQGAQLTQGDQASVLLSLLSEEHLGTRAKSSVEIGHNSEQLSGGAGANSAVLRLLGFATRDMLLLDGGFGNPAINLHKRLVTKDNVLQLLEDFQVPLEPDYVSVDIDSCDLWIFLAITTRYRPRVVSVEYNSNYGLENFTTLRCRGLHPYFDYQWGLDNIYGASLSAIDLAARHRGYSLVHVSRGLDAFLVRSDLLCPDTAPPLQSFQAETGVRMHQAYHPDRRPRPEELLLDLRHCRFV